MRKLSALALSVLFCVCAGQAWAGVQPSDPDPAVLPLTTQIPVPANGENIDSAPLPGSAAASSEEGINRCLPSPIVVESAQPVGKASTPASQATASKTTAKSSNAGAKPDNKGKLVAQGKASDGSKKAPASGEGKKMTVTAYAYCINGRTASGTRTGIGTVAVDPKLIPLGSKLYIPGYGWGKALDTGGSMRGRVIDIWFPSYSECRRWGVRDVTITVLPK